MDQLEKKKRTTHKLNQLQEYFLTNQELLNHLQHKHVLDQIQLYLSLIHI